MTGILHRATLMTETDWVLGSTFSMSMSFRLYFFWVAFHTASCSGKNSRRGSWRGGATSSPNHFARPGQICKQHHTSEVSSHSFIARSLICRPGASQQTFYGSPPTCPVSGLPLYMKGSAVRKSSLTQSTKVSMGVTDSQRCTCCQW